MLHSFMSLNKDRRERTGNTETQAGLGSGLGLGVGERGQEILKHTQG
jgi:hypothetical protein